MNEFQKEVSLLMGLLKLFYSWNRTNSKKPCEKHIMLVPRKNFWKKIQNKKKLMEFLREIQTKNSRKSLVKLMVAFPHKYLEGFQDSVKKIQVIGWKCAALSIQLVENIINLHRHEQFFQIYCFFCRLPYNHWF